MSLFLNYLAALIGVFLVAEVAVRLFGQRPWKPSRGKRAWRIEPEDTLYAKDAKLGHTHLAGKHRAVSNRDPSHSFILTHGSDTLRVTSPPERTPQHDTRSEIWIFGCSYTHGWGINDWETYPWLLQERYPEYHVINFGVTAYGTIHSLIQFEQRIASGRKPACVVLAYSGRHDMRNTMSRHMSKKITAVNALGALVEPHAYFSADGKLSYEARLVEYKPWPLMRYSAFIHTLEEMFTRWEMSLHRNHEVTLAAIRRFREIATHLGSPFVIAGIYRVRANMRRTLESDRFLKVNISVDLGDPKNNCRPYDPHPSAAANRVYADKLSAFLDANVFGNLPAEVS
ncbi:MAG: SGNH/GDSL hydrolase family protein [Candidatus Omnitrophota bacterium]|nr:SGNH/GDSL hydrolase family protein [Candidatus Omnitrophota bacterium]